VVVVAIGLLIGSGTYLSEIFDSGSPETETSADPTDHSQVALGQSVYADACASCHGANLEGQPNWRQHKADGRLPAPPHDDSGHTWHHDDQTLFVLTKHGAAKLIGRPIATDMPAFDGVLSDGEIWAVLAFIKSRWSAEALRRQAEMNKRASVGR
jgi:mono/diheme cytochrome c family protein